MIIIDNYQYEGEREREREGGREREREREREGERDIECMCSLTYFKACTMHPYVLFCFYFVCTCMIM